MPRPLFGYALATFKKFIPTAMQDAFEMSQNRQGGKIIPGFKVLNITCGHFHLFRHPFLRQVFPFP